MFKFGKKVKDTFLSVILVVNKQKKIVKIIFGIAEPEPEPEPEPHHFGGSEARNLAIIRLRRTCS
jgi:hypothetical protein